ncbi:MAG: PorV/PorQ family protein [Ignavibacteriales bacterium]|nr:PorV/PorQ family protein [Ignavibacteriales bacterium]
MKKLLFISVFLLTTPVLFSQSAGGSGLSFLKIGSGARNIALGDNGTVFANDATAIFYSPANLSRGNNSEISFTHNEWIQGVRTEMLAAKFSLFGLNMGFGVNSTRIGDIEVRERPGVALSTFTADFIAISLGTGFKISEKVSAGIVLKYLYEGMFYEDAAGYAADLSGRYTVNDALFLTAVVRNLGAMNELKTVATKLPTDFRVGVGYNFSMPQNKLNFSTGLEVQKFLSTDDIHINAGVEAVYDGLLAVRLGYQSLYEAKGLTTGIGIYWNSLAFDYALTPFGQDLGLGHTFSVKLGL